MRRPSSIAVVLLVLMLMSAPASAATTIVKMDNSYDFKPASVSIARGDSVRWKTIDSAFEDHDVFGTAPHAYFSSGSPGGIDPGESYTKRFPSAGRFSYVCRVHSSQGMLGSVTVPMSVSLNDGRFRITVASANLSSGSAFRHVVEVDPPGATGWTLVKQTTNAVVTYDPGPRGEYDFRARVKRVSGSGSGSFSGAVYRFNVDY